MHYKLAIVAISTTIFVPVQMIATQRRLRDMSARIGDGTQTLLITEASRQTYVFVGDRR